MNITTLETELVIVLASILVIYVLFGVAIAYELVGKKEEGATPTVPESGPLVEVLPTAPAQPSPQTTTPQSVLNAVSAQTAANVALNLTREENASQFLSTEIQNKPTSPTE